MIGRTATRPERWGGRFRCPKEGGVSDQNFQSAGGSNVRLTLAISGYDHVRDLTSGRVRAEGIELLNAIQDVYLCDDVTIA